VGDKLLLKVSREALESDVRAYVYVSWHLGAYFRLLDIEP
jgi:hypothetical protein